MDRVIIHSDANCFYASVEMLYHPEFAGKPLAVGGDPEARHGIVLTANYIAKKQGVKTGMALWQARQACPDVIFVPPRMDLYLKFSSMLREIYGEYTDKIEPYGCDEAWLDVSDSSSLKGDGRKSQMRSVPESKKNLALRSARAFPGIRFMQSLAVTTRSRMRLQNSIVRIIRV